MAREHKNLAAVSSLLLFSSLNPILLACLPSFPFASCTFCSHPTSLTSLVLDDQAGGRRNGVVVPQAQQRRWSPDVSTAVRKCFVCPVFSAQCCKPTYTSHPRHVRPLPLPRSKWKLREMANKISATLLHYQAVGAGVPGPWRETWVKMGKLGLGSWSILDMPNWNPPSLV
ncbi:hypothetical protein HDK77DRAFT_202030 [Phyllosticta capitalensis]|uniref:Uncharacterized protein n=1 Tax=Phyllosticta capitalensis TaxID=121624 RepID=A0ABR1YXC3_9PEZI